MSKDEIEKKKFKKTNIEEKNLNFLFFFIKLFRFHEPICKFNMLIWVDLNYFFLISSFNIELVENLN